MWEKKILKSQFDFILAYGFKGRFEKTTNYIFGRHYINDAITIHVSYDCYEHEFYASISKNGTLKYIELQDFDIGNVEERNRLKNNMDAIMAERKLRNRGMTKELYERCAKVYSDYMRKNLDALLSGVYLKWGLCNHAGASAKDV